MTAAIPEPVQALLRDDVTSFESLAIVLALHADPSRRSTVGELAEQVGIRPDLALTTLNSLCERSLVGREERSPQSLYWYSPIGPERARVIDALAHTFEEHRVAVINIMNAQAIERVRLGAVRTFSDAFLIGKKDKRDG